MVFDAPKVVGGIEARLNYARSIIPGHAHVKVIETDKLPSSALVGEDIKRRMKVMKTSGAEGLMIRHPINLFRSGRTADLLKVKHVQECDAIVVGMEMGVGRLEGRIGALIVELALNRSKTFKVGGGFNDDERALSLYEGYYKGKVIEVKHNDFTNNGIPRFPIYLRTKPEM